MVTVIILPTLPLTIATKMGYDYIRVRGEAIKFRPYDFIFGSGP